MEFNEELNCEFDGEFGGGGFGGEIGEGVGGEGEGGAAEGPLGELTKLLTGLTEGGLIKNAGGKLSLSGSLTSSSSLASDRRSGRCRHCRRRRRRG